MKKEKELLRRRRPSVADQLVVLLMSVGMGLLVLFVGSSAGRLVELVFLLITVFAVVTINVLFALSQWERTTGTEQRVVNDSGSGGRLSCKSEPRPQRDRQDPTKSA